MTHLELLLPFGLLPPTLGDDLLRSLNAPALAMLLARTRFGAAGFRAESSDPYARALPHELWNARRAGLPADPQAGGSPPLAAAALRQHGLTETDGHWFLLRPVHLHIARDHLVLTDWRRLQLTEVPARRLFDTARPLFEAAGKTLRRADADTWFVRADDWSELQTATPDAACGHSVDIWMPHGTGELAWRKLQNEVQMEWFTDPLNEERQAQGLEPVNSIWLWGGAPAADTGSGDWSEVFNLPSTMACGNAARHQADSPAQLLAAKPRRALLVLDQLSAAALASDWGYWLECLHALEREWFAPLLQALQAGEIGRLTLICSNATELIEASTSGGALRQFWIRPSLARLKR